MHLNLVLLGDRKNILKKKILTNPNIYIFHLRASQLFSVFLALVIAVKTVIPVDILIPFFRFTGVYSINKMQMLLLFCLLIIIVYLFIEEAEMLNTECAIGNDLIIP